MCLLICSSLFLSLQNFPESQTEAINNQVILLASPIQKWYYFSATKEMHKTGTWDTFSKVNLEQLQ